MQKRLYRDYAVAPLEYDLKKTSYGKLIHRIRGEKEEEGKKKDKKEGNKVPETCFNLTAETSQNDLAECHKKRNVIVSDLIAISDEMCQEHLQTIFGNDALFNVTTGTLTNVFSGAAALSGGLASGTRSLLSGLALFSNAERSLVNETVYKTMLATAITKKIGETRKKQREAIIQSLKENPDPIHLALLDVIDYHQTCSFMFGLQKALDEGTQDRPTPTPTPTASPQAPLPTPPPSPEPESTPTPEDDPSG